MRTDARTAADAFVNVFPKADPQGKQTINFAAEKDEKVIHENLRFVEKIFPNNGLMMCPVSHSGLQYVSESCETVFGHTHATLLRMGLPEFFALIHPEDLPPVLQCFDFMRSCAPYSPDSHRFVTHYRMRRNDGTYCYILDEKLAIKTTNGYLHILLFTKVPDDKFHQVRMEIYKNRKGNFVNSYTYNPKQAENKITPRQNDIARLIIKGLTNQEIADFLNVSVYTVKNHKQMLFRKINVRNSMELANYVRESAMQA
jgi:DNA-binding CsgD family transcriptional regulator